MSTLDSEPGPNGPSSLLARMRRHALFAPLQSKPAMRSLLERVRRDIAAQRAQALARASS